MKLILAPAQTAFDNKPALQNAADLWCSNATAALAEHGNIADWDVSRHRHELSVQPSQRWRVRRLRDR